jgi:hypothetical protein
MAPLGLIGFWVFVTLRQAQPGGWLADEEKSGTSIDWGRSTWHVVSRTFLGSPSGINLLFVPRPDHPIADLSRERIKLRPVRGGLINQYQRAA